MMLRIIAGVLLLAWVVLLLLGKSGFSHLLLIGAVGLATTEIVTEYRARMTER